MARVDSREPARFVQVRVRCPDPAETAGLDRGRVIVLAHPCVACDGIVDLRSTNPSRFGAEPSRVAAGGWSAALGVPWWWSSGGGVPPAHPGLIATSAERGGWGPYQARPRQGRPQAV